MAMANNIKGLMYVFIILIISVAGCIESTNEPKIPTETAGDGKRQTNELCLEWNIVSMPETISKYNVTIEYNGIIYSWNDSVSEGLILTFLYGYEDGRFYLYDTFQKYKGYWLYTYVDKIKLHENSTPDVVIRCKNITFTDESELELECDILIIAPEYYDNSIICRSINIKRTVLFMYDGDTISAG